MIWPYFFHLKLSYTRYNSKICHLKKVCDQIWNSLQSHKKTFKSQKYLKNRVIFTKSLKIVMSICEFYKFIYFMSEKKVSYYRGVFFYDAMKLGYIRYKIEGQASQ